jgi:hypothetical protein
VARVARTLSTTVSMKDAPRAVYRFDYVDLHLTQCKVGGQIGNGVEMYLVLWRDAMNVKPVSNGGWVL